MKFTMPMAVFGGLALIAAAIYFGSGSQPVNAAGGATDGVQKIAGGDRVVSRATVRLFPFVSNWRRTKRRVSCTRAAMGR